MLGLSGYEWWRGYFDAFAFYILALLGALGGSVGLLSLIWLPVFLFLLFVYYQMRSGRWRRPENLDDPHHYAPSANSYSSYSTSSSQHSRNPNGPRFYQGNGRTLHDD